MIKVNEREFPLHTLCVAFAITLVTCAPRSADVVSGAPDVPVARDASHDDLLRLQISEPWIDSPNTSEQFFPMYLGATPRKLVLGLPLAGEPCLPAALKKLASEQIHKLLKTQHVSEAELEAWPTEDWNGQPNWVYARWRKDAAAPWQWLDQQTNWRKNWSQTTGVKPLLPDIRHPDTEGDRKFLFADFLESDDLYQQPAFGNCVYVQKATGAITLAWPNPAERESRSAELTEPGSYVAYCMNPPARFNAEPVAFTLQVKGKSITWPANITWLPEPSADAMAVDQPVLITAWPDNFAVRYKQDVYETDGEADAHFPLSGKTARFVNKGSFQPNQDLEQLVDYLEERYQALGIKTVRQRFTWRGIPQSNLIAVIKGTETAPPVIMADHFDTACEEDTFAQSGERVTTKGADDNATATAALLGAASTLKDLKLKRDIWLLHLTGEEFPSDDLGARYFLSEMMKTKQDIYAVLITDFIGWHQTGQSAYQISPDAMPGSERMAALAIDAARKVSPNVTAIYQARNKERNSVFQTDVQEFEFYGIPGIVFNENMNYADNSGTNPNYHQSTDVAANLDFNFAIAVAKVAIETVARLANEP